MIQLTKKSDCCGCGACAQKCPIHCITMSADDQGFLYPVVDVSKCVECNICEKSCPMFHVGSECPPQEAYAAKNKDEDVRKESSSGGVFMLLAESIIKRHGVVFGARFNEDWDIVHDYSDSLEGLQQFRGSKYVQSKLGNCYSEVEQFLKKGQLVLFSGTPCQITGLRSYLQKEYDNLFLVDVICHGVPSPAIWHSYLNRFILKKGNVRHLSFREKSAGWKKYAFAVYYDDFRFYEPHADNLFMRGFLGNLYLRPSCYDCSFKSGKSNSDITIADFWGIQHVCPELDDDKGMNLLLVNSDKGRNLLECIECDKYKTEFESSIKYNPSFMKSAAKPVAYDWFWRNFPNQGCLAIDKALNRKPSIMTRLKSRIKNHLK